MGSEKRKLSKRFKVEIEKSIITQSEDEIAEKLAEEILKEISKPYFYLDAVARKDQGHIGFCTYRN